MENCWRTPGPLDFLSNNLVRLNVSHNRLQSLGGGLKKLKSLTDLDISFNYLDSMVLTTCSRLHFVIFSVYFWVSFFVRSVTVEILFSVTQWPLQG